MHDALRQRWNADALQRDLAPLRPGLAVEVVNSLASTNSALLERARAGHAAPCLLVAETQTHGRGRHGKHWHSAPAASLTFSLSLALAANDWSGLSLAVGLALAEALDAPAGSPPRGHAPGIVLKWPNDLMRVGPENLPRKLGGILIESMPLPPPLAPQRIAVIGIGLNIAPSPDAPPSLLSQGYASLQELHAGMTPPQALARLAAALLAMLEAFERHGFAALRNRYAARDGLFGQPVTTTLAHLPQGVADGIADDGALWLLHAGQRHRIASGEVSVRQCAAAGAAAGWPAC